MHVKAACLQELGEVCSLSILSKISCGYEFGGTNGYGACEDTLSSKLIDFDHTVTLAADLNIWYHH